jgi:tRNA dimethylallyltransferase
MAPAPVVLLMGPTASGKTGLAMALAGRLADRGSPAEIVSVDSAQVYRGMDIGTAKPDAAMRAAVPHHLLDVCDPLEPYSAARFVADAARAVAGIHARGRVPLLVGGSMLYFRAYTGGLSDLPAADPVLRAELAARALDAGWPALHAQLAQLDPVTAARLHPNDGHRVQRALEVVLSSGRPLSAQRARTLPSGGGFDGVKLALMPPDRARLHERIATRLQQMLSGGFADEVRRLHARGDLHPDLPAIRSVGYRQLWEWCEGRCELAQAAQKALEATRQFAKRQVTWLRSEHDPCWLNSEAPDVVDVALRRIDGWKPRSPC